MSPGAHRVVIVGGGYAGAMAAVRAAGRGGDRVEVHLVEPRSTLVQRLRLHQLAAGQQVRFHDLRRLVGSRVTHVCARAEGIDLDRARVQLGRGWNSRSLPFDRLILATGSTVEQGSVPGLRAHSHTLSTPHAAGHIRDAAALLPDGAVVAVCGAGLTGLEAAAEFAEAWPGPRIRLLTAGTLGEWLSPRGRARLERSLRALGVEVIDRTRVTAVEPEGPVTTAGLVPAALTVWCGGFEAAPLARHSGLPTDRRGAVLVDPTLRLPARPDIAAAGDAAALSTLPSGAALRMTCQAGMPAAAHAADAVTADLRGREAVPFDFGYIHQPVSLGRRDGLIQFVDRADRPRNRVLSGRRAALYKHLVTASAVPSIAFERRLPGALKWPASGRSAISAADPSPEGAP